MIPRQLQGAGWVSAMGCSKQGKDQKAGLPGQGKKRKKENRSVKGGDRPDLPSLPS